MPNEKQIILDFPWLVALANVDLQAYQQLVSNVQEALGNGTSFVMPEHHLRTEHIQRKLDDLINYQFGPDGSPKKRKRTLIELISNSIDSQATSVVLSDDNRQIRVADNAKGMDLYGLLYNLTVPFATTKDGITTRGRFGVGAKSNLWVLSKGGTLEVDTRKNGDHSHKAVYSKTENGSYALACSHGELASQGTTITITLPITQYGFLRRMYHKLVDPAERREYVQSYIENIDPQECNIFYNGRRLNHGICYKLHKKAKLFHIPFEGSHIKIAIGPARRRGRGQFRYLSDGFLVTKGTYTPFDLRIDYPLCIKPVESRTTFIETELYAQAQALAVSQAIIPYLQSHRDCFSHKLYEQIRSNLAYSEIMGPAIARASREELSTLLGFFTDKDVPLNQEIIAVKDKTENLEQFYSSSLVINGRNDGYGYLAKHLVKNSHVVDFEKVLPSSRKLYYKEIPPGEKTHYHLDALNESRKFDNLVVFFIDGPSDSKSPFASNLRYGDATRLYANQNHPLFNGRVPQSTASMALDYFLKRCLFGIKGAEDGLICMNGDLK